MNENTIFYNHTDSPIFITSNYVAHPSGLPGTPKTIYCVAPGEGIDLRICGLMPEKPENKIPRSEWK